eukprot:scaffold86350_cov27-Tisochrysis_lutea.AAC.1
MRTPLPAALSSSGSGGTSSLTMAASCSCRDNSAASSSVRARSRSSGSEVLSSAISRNPLTSSTVWRSCVCAFASGSSLESSRAALTLNSPVAIELWSESCRCTSSSTCLVIPLLSGRAMESVREAEAAATQREAAAPSRSIGTPSFPPLG